MKKITVSSLCIFVIAMFLISGTDPIPGNVNDAHSYHEKKETINSLQCRHGFLDTPFFRILQHLASLDNVDQSQEQNDGYYEIRGDTWCTQSFTPQTYGKLTGVELYMKKQTRIFSFPFLLKKGTDGWWDQDLGDLTLEVYDKLSTTGEPLTSVTLSRDSIAKKDGWILFDVPDIDVWIGDTYYLVLHTTGGGDKNYYTWYYGNGDPYGNGMGYHNINGGEGSWYPHDFDFCFRTYGEYSGKEPDGIVDRFAVLVYQTGSPNDWFEKDAVDMKDVLMHHGWSGGSIIIKTANLNSIRNGINQMAETADQDDVCIYFHESHGNEGGAYGVGYSQLDEYLDEVISNVAIILGPCHSGSAIPYLKQSHRVIITSCRSDELGAGGDPSINNLVFPYFLADETGAYSKQFKGKYGVPGPDTDGKYRDGAFARKSCDTNGDGWVSAEEAYRYASYWVPKCWNHGYPHPQMYDGCDGELLITRIN